MNKKLIIRSLLFACCVVAWSAGAEEQKIIQLEGKVFSRSADIPAGTSSTALYDVPKKKILIVTQFCSNMSMGVELNGSKLGRVPAGFDNCTTYVPGVQFSGAQTISCQTMFENPDLDIVCLINGFLQNKP